MKVQITPTPAQTAAACASVWGCELSDVTYEAEALTNAITITTDVKGAQKAERAIEKVEKDAGS